MRGRRTIILVALALAALTAAGAASPARISRAATPPLDVYLNDVRGHLKEALNWQERALTLSSAGGIRVAVEKAVGEIYDAFPGAGEVHPAAPDVPGFREGQTQADVAWGLDKDALGKLRGGDVAGAKALIRRAIVAKKKALELIPERRDSGCEVTRESYGGGGNAISVKTGSCEQPVSVVIFSFNRPFTVFGISILPSERSATCKKVNSKTTACKINPPLQPSEQLYADVKPKPPARGQVTTCFKAGRGTGCFTRTA